MALELDRWFRVGDDERFLPEVLRVEDLSTVLIDGNLIETIRNSGRGSETETGSEDQGEN